MTETTLSTTEIRERQAERVVDEIRDYLMDSTYEDLMTLIQERV